MTQTLYTTDVAVIGAGPVGLFAAFQCGMLDMSVTLIDALPEAGGQCAALYPEKPIYDIAGLPNVLAGDLIDNLMTQAAPFEPTYLLGQQAVSVIEEDNGTFHIVTGKGTEVRAKAVFIAAGPGAFGPNRPPLENLEAYEYKSLHYMVRNKCCFDGQTIMIAGGGDSAIDWVNALAESAEKVYLLHRRDKFRAAPMSVAKMEDWVSAGKVEKLIPFQLKALQGQDGQLENVQVASLAGEVRDIPCEQLLCFYGLKQDLGPLRDWELELDGYHIKIDPTTAETSRRGIYAMGDIASYPHKLKLIATGFAEVAQAAHHAYGIVHPGKELHFEHSTSRGLPQTNLEQKEA